MTDLSDGGAPMGMGPFVIVGDAPLQAAGLIAMAHPALVNTGEVAALQRTLAYSAARSDIELYCRYRLSDEAGNWFDSAVADPDDAEHVAVAVRYLSAMQLLRRHIDHPEWVNVLDLPELADAAA